MQKFIRLIMALFLAIGFLVPTNNVSATTYTVDQGCSNTDVTQYENIADNTPHQQGFRPTQNRLKEVNLKISGMSVDGDTPLRLRVLPFDSSDVLGESITQPTVDGPSMRNWTFSDEITLTPGDRYVLRLEKMSGNGTPYWFTNGNNCYDRGTASRGGVTTGYDYDFQTKGYTYTAPVPAEGSPDTTTEGSTATTTVTDTSSVTSATPDSVPVDSTLGKPVLIRYEKNGETANPPYTEEVDLKNGDKLNLIGTSFAGAKVLVFVNGKSYPADVVASGSWTAEVVIDDFTVGSQVIKAQAQKGTVGSEIVDILNIKVLGVTTTASAVTDAVTSPSNILLFGILIACLIILIVLLYFEHKKHILSNLFKKKEKVA